MFSSALYVRCFLHFRGNLEAKLGSLKVPKQDRVEFLHDIFHNPRKMEKGIVDADNENEFEDSLLKLRSVWNAREEQYNNPPEFYSWCVSNCKEAVKLSMLKEVRIEAGLGQPPDPYYTNDVESLNQVIKQQVKYRAQELPQFILSMKQLVVSQKKEIEKAVVDMGEYRLTEDLQHLRVQKEKFFQMNTVQ